MSDFAPFRTVRPAPDVAAAVVSPPYDVVSRAEARALSASNPLSYLHVVRADADFPDEVAACDDAVYEHSRRTFHDWLAEGVLTVDETPTYTVYREDFRGRCQTGVVGCAAIDDYLSGRIKRHEVTLVAKERDRIEHFDRVGAHTEPIWLAHRAHPALADLLTRVSEDAPTIDVTDAQGVRHRLWPLREEADITAVREAFASLDALYIADGHHRAASAAKVGLARREAGAGPGPHDEVMAVAFAADQLHVMDYNRVVTDLGDLTPDTLPAALEAAGARVRPAAGPVRPTHPRTFGCYTGGQWYEVTVPHDPARTGARGLDVSLLHDLILAPVLGITDPRTDPRIGFVGGIRGLDPLVERADATAGAAFTIPPVTMETVMDIADAGEIMPPKSTWFEPKLASGLFAHLLDADTSA